jgi:hypothetical protein
MKGIIMTAATAGLVALGLIAAGAFGSGGSAKRGDDHVRTIHLISTGTSFHLVDAPPAATSEEDLSPGDTVVFTDDLRSHGHKVGTDTGVCTLVAGSVAQCHATLLLPDGHIVVGGSFDFAEAKPNKLAITGGTRAFREAGGTLRIKHLSSTPVDTDEEVLRITD